MSAIKYALRARQVILCNAVQCIHNHYIKQKCDCANLVKHPNTPWLIRDIEKKKNYALLTFKWIGKPNYISPKCNADKIHLKWNAAERHSELKALCNHCHNVKAVWVLTVADKIPMSYFFIFIISILLLRQNEKTWCSFLQ